MYARARQLRERGLLVSQAAVRARRADPDRVHDRPRDPRLVVCDEPRPSRRSRAAEAAGPRHRRNCRLPDPAADAGAELRRRAPARRTRPGDTRGGWRDHRGDPGSRGPADDRQPDRRNRAAERPPVPRRRPRAHACRRRSWPGRGDRGVARAALHHAGQRRGPILVPNNVVLAGAVVPLREPSGVEVPTRTDPLVDLEEFVDGEVIVRVRATPVRSEDGSALADEVVAALDAVHTGQQAG